MKFLFILLSVMPVAATAVEIPARMAARVVSTLVSPDEIADFGLLILKPTGADSEETFVRMQFGSVQPENVAIFNLSNIRHPFELMSLFGPPLGFVQSEKPTPIESFVESLNGRRGLIIIRADERAVREAILAHVRNLIFEGLRVRDGKKPSLDNVSILVETKATDVIAPELNVRHFLKSSNVSLEGYKAWQSAGNFEAYLFSKKSLKAAIEDHCNTVLVQPGDLANASSTRN